MYVSQITIEEFRGFKAPTTIKLGKLITCIAGHNGVGKSTILAILGNCGELKGRVAKHLNGDTLRGEYSEIIKFDESDTAGQKAKLHFKPSHTNEALEVNQLDFRASLHSPNKGARNQELRYRLIPKATKKRKTVAKLTWPTYYLGLSRLYPVGESKSVSSRAPRLPDGIHKQFSEAYTQILGLEQDDFKVVYSQLSDAPKKKGAGIQTNAYGLLANSAGQDNVGQILLSVLSFENAKAALKGEYHGGLLLIDEIDATLHPAAQTRLYNWLKRKARELELQVVFTTHSLTLLEYIHNSANLVAQRDSVGNVTLVYLEHSRGTLEVHQNPSIRMITSDLESRMVNSSEAYSVPLVVEDQMALRCIDFLLSEAGRDLKIKSNTEPFSFQEIAKMVSAYPEFFQDALIVLDPDASTEHNRDLLRSNHLKTPFYLDGDEPSLGNNKKVLFLPGTAPLEEQFWKLVSELDAGDHFYTSRDHINGGVTKQSLYMHFVPEFNSKNNASEKKKFYKTWYHCEVPTTTKKQLFLRWYEKNKTECDKFIESFETEHNKLTGKQSEGEG